MQPPSGLTTSAVAANSDADAIFRQASNAGRETLSDAEQRALVPSLEPGFDADVASASASATVSPDIELRIRLHNSGEFGMVISADLGGLHAELAEDNLRQNRASVHAAAGLTAASESRRGPSVDHKHQAATNRPSLRISVVPFP